MIALSVAIPCCDEAGVLAELHRRLSAACREVAGNSYELVVVNDGSQDETWQVICELARADAHVIGVNLSRNYGHQLALTAALAYCEGERILIIDADLQDPPEILAEMMKVIDAGADVAYGQRRSRAAESFVKKMSAAAFYRLLERLTDLPIPPDTGDFRLITRRVLQVLQNMPEQHRFIRGMVSWVGFRQVPVLYDRAPRFAGRTKYPLRRMVTFALDAVTSFSVRPLRVAMYLGSAMFVAAAGLIAVAIVWWLVFTPFPGWTSLMVVILAIGGLQTFILGLIGEYLSRLYLQAKHRPLYVVGDVIALGRSPAVRAESTSAGLGLEPR